MAERCRRGIDRRLLSGLVYEDERATVWDRGFRRDDEDALVTDAEVAGAAARIAADPLMDRERFARHFKTCGVESDCQQRLVALIHEISEGCIARHARALENGPPLTGVEPLRIDVGAIVVARTRGESDREDDRPPIRQHLRPAMRALDVWVGE